MENFEHESKLTTSERLQPLIVVLQEYSPLPTVLCHMVGTYFDVSWHKHHMSQLPYSRRWCTMYHQNMAKLVYFDKNGTLRMQDIDQNIGKECLLGNIKSYQYVTRITYSPSTESFLLYSSVCRTLSMWPWKDKTQQELMKEPTKLVCPPLETLYFSEDETMFAYRKDNSIALTHISNIEGTQEIQLPPWKNISKYNIYYLTFNTTNTKLYIARQDLNETSTNRKKLDVYDMEHDKFTDIPLPRNFTGLQFTDDEFLVAKNNTICFHKIPSGEKSHQIESPQGTTISKFKILPFHNLIAAQWRKAKESTIGIWNNNWNNEKNIWYIIQLPQSTYPSSMSDKCNILSFASPRALIYSRHHEADRFLYISQ